jgi:hypothetical protein
MLHPQDETLVAPSSLFAVVSLLYTMKINSKLDRLLVKKVELGIYLRDH